MGRLIPAGTGLSDYTRVELLSPRGGGGPGRGRGLVRSVAAGRAEAVDAGRDTVAEAGEDRFRNLDD